MARLSLTKIGASIMVLAVSLSACDRKVERNITVTNPETGEKTEVNITKDMFSKDKEINITSQKDGTSLKITKGAVSNSMPNFVTAYPGATEISTMQAQEDKSKNGGGDTPNKMTMLSFKSPDAAAKIIDFYKTGLQRHGFTEEATMNIGPMHMSTLINKSTKQMVQIMANKEAGGSSTSVQLIYGSEN
jgi:hypothetical protein